MPDWTAVWSTWSTVALAVFAFMSFVAAGLAALFVKRGVDTVLMAERFKRIEEQIKLFETPELQTAYNAEMEPARGSVRARQVEAEFRLAFPQHFEQMRTLVNYIAGSKRLVQTAC